MSFSANRTGTRDWLKGEKMDFIIQKAVELGVSEIIPVAMEHSVVRLEGDKAVKKAERWQKIAEAAAKQSKRDIYQWCSQYRRWNRCLLIIPVTVTDSL